MTRPVCPTCGKPAPALTTTVWVVTNAQFAARDTRLSRTIVVPDGLWTIEDCRKHTNQKIVSVIYSHYKPVGEARIRRHVTRFGEWDGESYWHHEDPFCTGKCAARFACAAFDAGFRLK